MKRFKIFIMVMALLFSSVMTDARVKLYRADMNEVSLSYGQGSIGQGIYLFADVFAVIFSLGHATVDNPVFTGEVSTEYYHYFNNTIGVGGIVTGEWMGGNMIDQNKSEDDPNRITGRFDMVYVSLMPAVKFSWFNHNHVGMYSKVAVGGSLVLNNNEAPQPMVAFQLSPVCCDFGDETWRGFAELGFGNQGILNLGVKYIF